MKKKTKKKATKREVRKKPAALAPEVALQYFHEEMESLGIFHEDQRVIGESISSLLVSVFGESSTVNLDKLKDALKKGPPRTHCVTVEVTYEIEMSVPGVDGDEARDYAISILENKLSQKCIAGFDQPEEIEDTNLTKIEATSVEVEP